MESLLLITMIFGVFFAGIALGAIIENKRTAFWALHERVDALEATTQEILCNVEEEKARDSVRLPMAQEVTNEWVDYDYYGDPGKTMELPKINT